MGAFELMSQQRVVVETEDSFKVSAGYGQVRRRERRRVLCCAVLCCDVM
jgi:hypothetical protein